MTNNVEEFLATQGIKHAAADGMPNTSVCIVALPRATDPIRLVGDVDKHATLMFFGDMATLPDDAKTTMTETLQNVMQLFSPFGEQILDIGRLGSDNPPALVAMLSGSNLSRIRDALLINPKLGEYLQNNPNQYPNYTPHVTLAYPDYQEEAALRQTMKQLYKVRFDRLSLWWGDEQIDFSLETMDEMAQAEKLEAFLAHHGVKGMKWGVRRSSTTLDRAAGRKPDAVPKGTDVRSRIAMKLSKPGSVITRADGKVFIKKTDGSWGETHLSSEAENMIRTRQTAAHELSNKDLSDALARARLIEDYNKFFNDPNGREMKAQVERLQLQKNYSQIHSEMNPTATKKAVGMIASAGAAYLAYKKLDKASEGKLSKTIGSTLSGGYVGKHAAGYVAKTVAKDAAKAVV